MFTYYVRPPPRVSCTVAAAAALCALCIYLQSDIQTMRLELSCAFALFLFLSIPNPCFCLINLIIHDYYGELFTNILYQFGNVLAFYIKYSIIDIKRFLP